MNDLDLCLEVVQGHVNHYSVNISKTIWARDFKFGTRLSMGSQAGAQIISLKVGVARDPIIIGIRSNIYISSKLFEHVTSNLVSGLPLTYHCCLTVGFMGPLSYCAEAVPQYGRLIGYPSASLASCLINFSSVNPDTENNANLDAISLIKQTRPTSTILTRWNFFKRTPKLIIFGTHNLQTFKHNTLIKKLLLMQFYSLIFVLNCIIESDGSYCLITYQLFRTFSTSPLMLFFVQPLSGLRKATVLSPSICRLLSSSSICTECIVAKRCVLEQKLLLTAYMKSRLASKCKMNDLDLCFKVVWGHVNHCVTFAIEYLYQ